MFACCELCYEKYIDKDGNVDIERFNKLKETIPLNPKRKTICTCICHKDGMTVMH